MKYRLSPREILRAEPEGFPEGSGDISLYTPTRVTIQSFSITSTSQYFLALGPPEEAQYGFLLLLGAIRTRIGLPGLRRPQYEKILASRGRSIVTLFFNIPLFGD